MSFEELLELHGGSALLSHVRKKGFRAPSPIQKVVIPLFAGNKDVAVEACTGSGKTLAYLLPVFIRLLRLEDKPDERRVHLLWLHTVILAPTRELVQQICEVAKEVLADVREAHPTLLQRCRIIEMYGGRKAAVDRLCVANAAAPDTQGILIATPGRLRSQLLESNESTLRREQHWTFRAVEVLIIDEADELFGDANFQEQMRLCLSALPKQRRTGVFSATLTSELKALTHCGMRNPAVVKLALEEARIPEPLPMAGTSTSDLADVEPETTAETDLESSDQEEALSDLDEASLEGEIVDGGIHKTFDDDSSDEDVAVTAHFIPIGLRNYYMFAEQDERIPLLLRVLESDDYHKVLVFTATCASTDFTHLILSAFYAESGFAKILRLHGKLERSQRQQALNAFAEDQRVKTEIGDVQKRVLIASDLAARGIDFKGIDLIIQLDPPNDPSQTFHRMGRTARAGGRGDTLLFLSKHEDSFLNLMRGKGIRFNSDFPLPSPLQSRRTDDSARSAALPPPLPEDRGELRLFAHSYIQEQLKSDKWIYEKAKDAFVSHIRAYKEHQLSFVFDIALLDIGRVANRFGLFRIPFIKELKRRHGAQGLGSGDASWPNFMASDFDDRQIVFKTEAAEQKYQLLSQKRSAKREVAQQKALKAAEKRAEVLKAKRSASARRKRKRTISAREEMEERDDIGLMKKRKKQLQLLRTRGAKLSKSLLADDEVNLASLNAAVSDSD